MCRNVCKCDVDENVILGCDDKRGRAYLYRPPKCVYK